MSQIPALFLYLHIIICSISGIGYHGSGTTMNQRERAGIMRIVTDILRADAVIDLKEIEFLNDIKHKYKIGKDDELTADSITLSEAFAIMHNLDDAEKSDICNDFRSIIFSNNICTREESLMILAVTTCLSDGFADRCEVYSVPQTHCANLDYSQVLYVEGEYYLDTNREISEHYRDIINEFRLSGFNFVYIPKLSEHYRSLSKADLQSFITFLYPSASSEQNDRVARQLAALSTSDFCKTQIVGKMKMQELAHALPSVLFRVGASIVGGNVYENFLSLSLDDDALVSVRHIVDTFVQIYKPRILNPTYEETNRFVCSGYQKLIFDSLIYQSGVRSSVVVNIVCGEIFFPEIDAKISGLSRREKALYALILSESASGGINFSKPDGGKSLEKYNRRIGALQTKYRMIYKNFGGESENAPLLEVSTNRNPMISKIKNQIRLISNQLNRPDDYLVQRNEFGNYCVALPPELCLCYDAQTNSICPMKESDFWRKLQAM